MMQMLLESGLSSDHQTSVLLAAESLGCLMVLIESLLVCIQSVMLQNNF